MITAPRGMQIVRNAAFPGTEAGNAAFLLLTEIPNGLIPVQYVPEPEDSPSTAGALLQVSFEQIFHLRAQTAAGFLVANNVQEQCLADSVICNFNTPSI